MQQPSKRKLPWLPTAGLFILPAVLFVLVLFLRIPAFISAIFLNYSAPLFFALIFFYYLSFCLRGKAGWLAGLSLTAVLFGITLSSVWSSGFSTNFIIAGLLPYKDAKNYYVGADLILHGLPLPSLGQAAWRPLFPGLLASLFLLTAHNLQVTLAVLVALTGLITYLTARQVLHKLGPLATAVYLASLYIYVQQVIGFTLSEIPGFLLGCLGFILLWRAAESLNLFDLGLGLVVLTIGVSLRAGAFFIFPMLVLWAGWIFRGEKRFSWRAAILSGLVFSAIFIFSNTLFPRLIESSRGTAFGNFAYTLYGQVRGGTGWHQAIEDIGNSPDVVYQAALDFFLRHPFSLGIGIVKSYRDFFLPNGSGIFQFRSAWYDAVLWYLALALLLWAVYRAARQIKDPISSLILVGFIGIFLSIPFLPPIDGGSRFHASSMAFFLVLPAAGLSSLVQKRATGETFVAGIGALRDLSILLILLVAVWPLALYHLGSVSQVTSFSCPAGQEQFAIELHSGSYVDIIPDDSTACGKVPSVCASTFVENGYERSIDDFFQALEAYINVYKAPFRIIPAIDLYNQGQFHYFVGKTELFNSVKDGDLVLGCALPYRTDTQSIHEIRLLLASGADPQPASP